MNDIELIKEIKKEIKDVIESERLVTARLVDSVQCAAQLAGTATPEMQDMFRQWLGLIGEQLLRECGDGECDVQPVAQKIGLEETTLFSLLVSMHRAGRIRVEHVRFSGGSGKNQEICDCLV